MFALVPSVDTRTEAILHSRRTLASERSTCEEVDSVVDFLLVERIAEEVVAFKVLIRICENDCIFECDGGRGDGVVVDHFGDGLGEEEVEVDIVLASEVGGDCVRKGYF